MEIVSEDRLLHLSRQVARMRLKGVNRRVLAEIALETLVTRIEMENIVKQKISKEQKKIVRKNLGRLEDLEKSIVSLYFLGKLRGERWIEGSIFSSIARRYPFEMEK